MARPEKEISWDVVERRMEAGCSGIEIAATLRIQDNTFYERFKKKYGKSFQDYRDSFREAGKSNIRFTQYMKALSGNIPMLLLLGREWLGQGKLEELKSPLDESIALRHENMLLRAEIQSIKNAQYGQNEAQGTTEG